MKQKIHLMIVEIELDEIPINVVWIVPQNRTMVRRQYAYEDVQAKADEKSTKEKVDPLSEE